VLLAEDNPINAMLARTLLAREGCSVDHVTDGEAALEALVLGGYDLVLMDVRMPRLSGMEATRALRARGVETPVVALTANAFEDDRRACLAAGMDDFLVKPLSPEALRRALLLWTGPGWTAARKHAKLAG
jgi:CheY-like chemotaxis protein